MSNKRSFKTSRRYSHGKDSCKSKLHYPTMAQAELEIERARTYRGETLRAYACGKCGKIHLTSKEKMG